MMNLHDLIRMTPAPEPWSEGENIPWNEAGFSERMLNEHLLYRGIHAALAGSILRYRPMDVINSPLS